MGFEFKSEKFLHSLIILQFDSKKTKCIQNKTGKYFQGHSEQRKVKQIVKTSMRVFPDTLT